MAEKVYTTRALVIGERASGEASKVFTLFTRDLGLVQAYARSVREVRSKLRFNLSLHNFSRITLVPGREYWKVIGAEESRGGPPASVCVLLTRFLGAHEPHLELFDELLAGGEEQELTLTILDRLGYVGRKAESPGDREKLIDRALYASHL